jgi:hypothetical protein
MADLSEKLKHGVRLGKAAGLFSIGVMAMIVETKMVGTVAARHVKVATVFGDPR